MTTAHADTLFTASVVAYGLMVQQLDQHGLLSPAGGGILFGVLVLAFAAIQAKRLLDRHDKTYDATIEIKTMLSGDTGMVRRLEVVAKRAHDAENAANRASGNVALMEQRFTLLEEKIDEHAKDHGSALDGIRHALDQAAQKQRPHR